MATAAAQRLRNRTKPQEQEPKWENVKVPPGEIPRRKNSNGSEGGPYIYPPGAEFKPGKKKCQTCGRMVAADRRFPRKGTCKCLYYKRTTTFIDVLQDEYLLKQWGKRNVAWGMGQRPDLILAATACKPDTDKSQPGEDKSLLNDIVRQAQETAEHMKGATIGTSLHKLTHRMDRGEELGYIPEPYPQDLKAYDETIKRLGIEWVSIESFRVYDGWVDPNCQHKWGECKCMGIGGTVDRIGWYKGRLRIFDIKTGSDFNKMGHAMQLNMYGRMVPYQFPGDTRGVDPDEIDLDVGYIIKLPEGQGHCELEAMDLRKGHQACEVAKLVWDMRNERFTVERDLAGELTDMAGRAGSIKECQVLWRNASEMGVLDGRAKAVLLHRVEELKAQGITQ